MKTNFIQCNYYITIREPCQQLFDEVLQIGAIVADITPEAPHPPEFTCSILLSTL